MQRNDIFVTLFDQTLKSLNNLENIIREHELNGFNAAQAYDEIDRKMYSILSLEEKYYLANLCSGNNLFRLSGHFFSKIAQETGRFDAWISAAKSYSNAKIYDKAGRCFEQAARLGNRSLYCWRNAGINYLQVSLYEDARFCFRKAVEIANAPEDWKNEGHCLLNLKDYKTAAFYLQRVAHITNDPDDWKSAGNCSLHLRDYKTAAFCLQKAAHITNDPEDWKEAGHCALNLKYYKSAVFCFQNAAHITNDPEDWKEASHYAQNLQDYKSEVFCLQRVAEITNATEDWRRLAQIKNNPDHWKDAGSSADEYETSKVRFKKVDQPSNRKRGFQNAKIYSNNLGLFPTGDVEKTVSPDYREQNKRQRRY